MQANLLPSLLPFIRALNLRRISDLTPVQPELECFCLAFEQALNVSIGTFAIPSDRSTSLKFTW